MLGLGWTWVEDGEHMEEGWEAVDVLVVVVVSRLGADGWGDQCEAGW